MSLKAIASFFAKIIGIGERAAPLDSKTRTRLMHLYYFYDAIDDVDVYTNIRDERIRISAHTKEKKELPYVVQLMDTTVNKMLDREGFDALLATLTVQHNNKKAKEDEDNDLL